DRASLDGQRAAIRVGGPAAAAGYLCCMQRRVAEQWMRVPDEFLALNAIDLCQEQAGVSDRIDADVIAAAVRGASGQRHLSPGESLVRGCNRQPRWLGDDAGVGSHAALDQASRAGALPL